MTEEISKINDTVRILFSEKMDITVPADDTHLFEEGYLDSLGFVKMLSLLEEEFNMTISMEELDFENFKTIGQITEFVNRRINEKDYH